MKEKLAAALMSALLLCSCGAADTQSAQPSVIKAGGASVSLLDSSREIKDKLGEKITFDYQDSDKAVVRGSVADGFEGFDGNYYEYGYYSPIKDKAGKFSLYNGIKGTSSEEDVKKALGDSCMSISEGGQTVYYEAFVNGQELDYSSVELKVFDESVSDTVNMSKSIRASCEKQLGDTDGGNYILISYECIGGKVNLMVNVFKKGK